MPPFLTSVLSQAQCEYLLSMEHPTTATFLCSNSSSLSWKARISVGQTNVKSGTSQDELALAGKGFNDQVEASFMKENRKLDYAWVNLMETFKVKPEMMTAFLVQGELGVQSEGGAQ